ncbi:hypothetical protein CA13_40210 [Planctomycetes bacterium CA13]|uniref:AAA+ ATPase domain-containing protein n=1 Tax=Novipirellula herctigrandis TaxID=2527986 RepID=A0A5C5Z5H1_9BACT|nr:hypothetical protein CA13_40210 [Planctomycetes bacterium CA13]
MIGQSTIFPKVRCGRPWGWCNLFRNPFGELTPDERAELAVVDISEIVGVLNQPRIAIQFIGECGRGKTTRMLAIGKELPEAAYVYLEEDRPCGAIPTGYPLMIDEAQRLPRSVMRTIFSSGLTLVLATHRDLSRPLRSFGYRVKTYRLGRDGDANLIWECLNRRIEASRLNAGPIPVLSRADAAELVRQFGSDIRAMESYLYDQVQKQVYSDGEMRFID